MSKVDFGDVLRAIDELIKPSAAPEGWYTAHQFAEQWRLSLIHTRRKLKIGVEAGILESRDYPVKRGKSYYPTPHYRFTGPRRKTT